MDHAHAHEEFDGRTFICVDKPCTNNTPRVERKKKLTTKKHNADLKALHSALAATEALASQLAKVYDAELSDKEALIDLGDSFNHVHDLNGQLKKMIESCEFDYRTRNWDSQHWAEHDLITRNID